MISTCFSNLDQRMPRSIPLTVILANVTSNPSCTCFFCPVSRHLILHCFTHSSATFLPWKPDCLLFWNSLSYICQKSGCWGFPFLSPRPKILASFHDLLWLWGWEGEKIVLLTCFGFLSDVAVSHSGSEWQIYPIRFWQMLTQPLREVLVVRL